jgi:orotate phosphoribosyltransferase
MGQLALDEDWTLPAFVVRKEPKTHGRQRLIEGTVAEGANIVIVDDVITSGDSVLRAIDAVENARAHVARVIVLVDREEGGREVLHKYDYQSIFTIADLRE